MPRKAKELSALEVRRLNRPGRWSVGGVDGLALQVTAAGAKSWVLRISVAGRQREMGLGSFPTVPLADARDKARQQRVQLEQGGDPIAARQMAINLAVAQRDLQQTFANVAALYISHHEKSWKNSKHAAQWRSTLQAYAEPVIGQLMVRDIATPHVLKVLESIWSTKTETASRVRSRIELVLDFAAARGLREGPNPARWRGNLDAALPKASKVQRQGEIGRGSRARECGEHQRASTASAQGQVTVDAGVGCPSSQLTACASARTLASFR